MSATGILHAIRANIRARSCYAHFVFFGIGVRGRAAGCPRRGVRGRRRPAMARVMAPASQVTVINVWVKRSHDRYLAERPPAEKQQISSTPVSLGVVTMSRVLRQGFRRMLFV